MRFYYGKESKKGIKKIFWGNHYLIIIAAFSEV
jgi:hypothetical protein